MLFIKKIIFLFHLIYLQLSYIFLVLSFTLIFLDYFTLLEYFLYFLYSVYL